MVRGVVWASRVAASPGSPHCDKASCAQPARCKNRAGKPYPPGFGDQCFPAARGEKANANRRNPDRRYRCEDACIVPRPPQGCTQTTIGQRIEQAMARHRNTEEDEGCDRSRLFPYRRYGPGDQDRKCSGMGGTAMAPRISILNAKGEPNHVRVRCHCKDHACNSQLWRDHASSRYGSHSEWNQSVRHYCRHDRQGERSQLLSTKVTKASLLPSGSRAYPP